MSRLKIIGQPTDVETIAVGRSIRTLKDLQKRFGRGRWRKLKGIATIQSEDESIRKAEVHWYEAHGIGRVLIKVKRYVD